jgi:hypothetical protein
MKFAVTVSAAALMVTVVEALLAFATATGLLVQPENT